ncbi:MAG: OsmC family peroxiredoxin [Planctomycetes bacterium]|nr:OsmC family peroxiredoxin [Planctomycetota bacterium]
MSDSFLIELERLDGYRFRAEFGDGIPALVTDEGPPLGQNGGPNPTRMLATAPANCLSASFLFCLSRSRVEVGKLRTTARATLVRNEQKRLRVGRIAVELHPELPGVEPTKVQKCLEQFEDFCSVTASVRAGLPVGVRVVSDGVVLYERAS